MAVNYQIAQQQFAMLYERNYQLVYRICYTYMKNQYDAEDCLEDVFVKVYTGNIEFNDEDHEKAWLTVASINTCKDHLKQFWRKKVVGDELIENRGVSGRKDSYLLQEVMALPEKYKDVIYLHYYLGYKSEEIAKMLKRTASTVRNQLAEGRKMLKIRLEEIENE
ncbi:MAG: RNA polymerase sigma factor [Erysipelotrichaceae bacterium]|nr:RNA polymerase sigma factor [Erysipelotrichaceae bacterium]